MEKATVVDATNGCNDLNANSEDGGVAELLVWLSLSKLRETGTEKAHHNIVHFVVSATANEVADVRCGSLQPL